MANYFVRSTDGSDADNGSTWALAKATIAGALAIAAAGDTIYVSKSHAETQATAMTLTFPGTVSSPNSILCVDDTGDPSSPTTLATTATCSTTGASAMTFAGCFYCYGITFSSGSSSLSAHININSTNPWYSRFERCKLKLATTNASTRINVGSNSTGSDDQLLELINTDIEVGATAQGIAVRAPIRWTGGSVVGATLPNAVFLVQAAGSTGNAVIRGVDFSTLGSGKSLVDLTGGNWGNYDFERCKLGSSVSVFTGPIPGQGGGTIRLKNSDSSATNYRYQKSTYQGTITQETTIVRSGDATDGTTPFSRKMVTTSSSQFYSPLESDPIAFWNETTGSSVNIDVEVITDGVTLKDDEAWVEVEYLGNSSFPISSITSDRKTDILATGTNQTTSSVTWTTTGLTSPVKQKLSVSVTPQMKGLIRAVVYLAKPSTTMYFGPLVLTGSGRQYIVSDHILNEGASGGGGSGPFGYGVAA